VSRDEFRTILGASTGTEAGTGTGTGTEAGTGTGTGTEAGTGSEPAPESEPALESESTWAIAAGYSGTMLSADSVAHGPELGAERRWPRLRLGMTLSQHFQQTVTRTDVGMGLLSSGIRVFVALPKTITSHLSRRLDWGRVDATLVTPNGNGASLLSGDRSLGPRDGHA